MTVIFGGTGTLGKAIVKQIYGKQSPIHIVSRCEIRQAEMRELYPKCKFHLGDVTNPFSLPHIKNPGAVYNLAAMKHVELAEDNFEYCFNANYQGVVNTYSWAFEHKATSYCQSSTDKAVLPVNTYGICKALGEKYLYSRNTEFPVSVFSWPNVVGSRGSVLHRWKKQIEAGEKIKITNDEMTRFFVHIEDVAAFMVENHSFGGGPLVPPFKAATIVRFARALYHVMGEPWGGYDVIGIRPGEKIHETMLIEGKIVSSDNYDTYTDNELIELVRRSI
jgi:UDP-N-acetylglucosamine 4,6-dehydratase